MNISETRTALFCCCRAFLFVFFFLSPPVWPQANQGTIEGIIVDQSGAALPGAKLTGTNDATGIHFQTTSDSNGLFTFPVLPVGTYTIEVEHPSFEIDEVAAVCGEVFNGHIFHRGAHLTTCCFRHG